MEILPFILMGIGILVVFAAYQKVTEDQNTIKLNGSSKSSLDSYGPNSAAPAGLLSEEQIKAEILRLMESNDKIEAIKFLRQQRSLGLKDAKDMIDNFTATGVLRVPMVQSSKTDMLEMTGSATEDVKVLLRLGNKMQALKTLRAKTGLGLQEAVREIEKMERGM